MAEARRLVSTEGDPLCLRDAYQLEGDGEMQTIIAWEDLETQILNIVWKDLETQKEIVKEPVIVWEDLETQILNIVWEDLETQKETLKEPVIV